MGMAGHAQARKKKLENFFSSSTPIRKVNMFKPPNSNVLKILPSTGCPQPRLSHFFTQKKNRKVKIFFHRFKMVQFAKLTCLNRQIPIF